MISGIILAAGESSRFGSLKQIYQINNKTFIEHILENLIELPLITEIIVGLGYQYKKIMESINISSTKIKFAINYNWPRGQLSTLQECIKTASPYTKGYLVTLVDQPFVKKETYKIIIDEYINYGLQNIIIPTYDNHRGHPVLFPISLKEELMQAPLTEGARAVIKKFKSLLKCVNTIDEFIIADFDRIEDLERIVYEKRVI